MKQLDLSWISSLMQKYTALNFYIEFINGHPSSEKRSIDGIKINKLHNMGFLESNKGMLATKTRLVLLTKSRTKILSEMKSKTRYNIKLARKKGVRSIIVDVSKPSERRGVLKDFVKLLNKNNLRTKMFPVSRRSIEGMMDSFGKNVYVSAVYKENELIAASLYLVTDGGAYYSLNCSSDRGRKLMSPTLSIWEGILEAKRRGLKWFDFDGIFDDRYPIERWRGFSRFKEGFGGIEVEYMPALTKLLI